ncbi:MAG: HAMP domain-containing sensor histidine kinase [Phycisphaerae bacterium]|jgi:signal transduction histidine kinase
MSSSRDVVIASLEATLIATQRLAMLGSMSAMFAHEINNLVTPILARADFALGTGSIADMRKALERARTQVQHVVSLSERLMGLARGDEPQAETCSVAKAVEEAVAGATRPFAKDGIELNINVPPDLRVRAPQGVLMHVLLNLLLNAREAMNSRAGRLTVAAQRDGEYAVIRVKDTGQGIDPERLANVVNPFLAATADDDPLAWQNVGLGLCVCRLLTRQCGATIEAAANEGPGCTFRVRWPIAPAEFVQ